jgi:mycothiol S-conjugate amidase
MIAAHAHPDDEASKGGATMAKYAAQGVRVVVATFTGGERGDILNPALIGRTDIAQNIAAVRREEAAAAARALGVEQHFLGFVDSGFPEGENPPPPPAGSFATIEPEVAAVPLVAMIREIKPQVVTTYDQTGGYPHPDHIHTHTCTMAALRLAADAAFRPDLGPAFQVPKVYYNQGLSTQRLEAIHAAMLARGLESPFAEWLEERKAQARRSVRITARIEAADYFAARDAALLAYATQVDPDGWFFAVPRDIEREVWPWEEFELAFSALPRPEAEETDLFGGFR